MADDLKNEGFIPAMENAPPNAKSLTKSFALCPASFCASSFWTWVRPAKVRPFDNRLNVLGAIVATLARRGIPFSAPATRPPPTRNVPTVPMTLNSTSVILPACSSMSLAYLISGFHQPKVRDCANPSAAPLNAPMVALGSLSNTSVSRPPSPKA